LGKAPADTETDAVVQIDGVSARSCGCLRARRRVTCSSRLPLTLTNRVTGNLAAMLTAVTNPKAVGYRRLDLQVKLVARVCSQLILAFI